MVPKVGLGGTRPAWCHYMCGSAVLSTTLYLVVPACAGPSPGVGRQNVGKNPYLFQGGEMPLNNLDFCCFPLCVQMR